MRSEECITFRPLGSLQSEDERQIGALIQSAGWTESQIEGQVAALRSLAASEDGCAFVAERAGRLLGYISAQFYAWNRLGQIHGLVVDPEARRQHVARCLVEAAEAVLREKGARGVYVDTPVDNEGGRRFYEALGYELAYVMPQYYDVGKDGVTYIRFLS